MALAILLHEAVSQFRRVFQAEKCVDFTEIATGALDALGLPARAVSLDCQIQHLLVDEFQDTSRSQYELLARLVKDWQPGDGRTLFLVGDPMQSIYGFREAEVGLFLRARTNGIKSIELISLRLSTNFRSSPQIIEWVNEAIGNAFPDSEDEFTGRVTYEPSEPFRDDCPESAVRVHPFMQPEPEWRRAEAERVVEIIDGVQSKDPHEKIAVLIRARTHLTQIVSALRKNGKKFRAVDIDVLGEHPVVRDLMALTQALLHPGNRLAWLSILRAPWCGLTPSDLKALIGCDDKAAIWDLLQDQTRREQLSPAGRERLGCLIPLLRNALAQRGRLPIRRWVEGVWIALSGPACLETPSLLEDAAAYLDLLG